MNRFLFVLLVVPTLLFGQNNISEEAAKEVDQGSNLLYSGKPQESINYLKNGAQLWSQAENWEKFYEVQALLLTAYNAVGSTDSAIYLANKALSTINSRLGAESLSEANIHLRIGITHYYKGDIESAIESFTRSAEIKKTRLGPNSPDVAAIYNNLGAMYDDKFNHNQALRYYKRALDIWVRTTGEKTDDVANAYVNIGQAYMYLADYNKAFEYYDKALEVRIAVSGAENTKIVNIYQSYGVLYGLTKEYEKALEYNKKALALIEKIASTSLELIANAHSNIGRIYLDQGRLKSARASYRNALSIFKTAFGPKHPYVAITYNNLAEAYDNKGLYTDAIKNYQKAMVASVIDFNDSIEFKNNPDSHNYLRAIDLLVALSGKASSLKKLYDRTDSTQYLELSQLACAQADTLLTKIRRDRISELDKLTLADYFFKISQQGLINALAFYNIGEDMKYIELAHYFMERNRSNILSSVLYNEKGVFEPSKSAFFSEENDIKSRIDNYRTALLGNPDDSLAQIYRDSIFSLEDSYEALVQQLSSDYPNYYNLKYNTETASVDKLQVTLGNDEAVIEYFDGDNSIYALIVTKQHKNIVKINKQPDFESQINVLKKSLVSDVDTVFSRTSYAVYQQIFEPLSHLLIDHKKLKILPDGVLWNINFDLLLTNLPKSNNYRNYDYLIKDFIISYDYSTQLLIDVRNSHKKSNSRVLAFSYSNENTGTDGIVADLRTLRSAEVDDLPGSREEIKSISRFMDGDYFYGSEANEKNFKEIAHQYGILHLAVHGEISDDRPDESKLYLTDAKDSIQDNILHAFELYNLKLNAEMAVLSACNTGEGQIIKGEGIMNLGRAFTYAGVKSMVVTQWEVPDDITPRIVRTFYEGLDHGMSKSEALRNAKLKFLEASPELTVPPFYWGSFVLIGDDSPIGDGVDFTSIILGIIGLILCIIIIGFLLKRRNISRSVQG